MNRPPPATRPTAVVTSVVPVTTEQADCVAQVLHDSDVSDETLTAIAENDADYSATSDEQNTLTQAITEAQTACV